MAGDCTMNMNYKLWTICTQYAELCKSFTILYFFCASSNKGFKQTLNYLFSAKNKI